MLVIPKNFYRDILLDHSLATSFFGICIGLLLPRPELVTVLILFTFLPIVFSAGFVWLSSKVKTFPDSEHYQSKTLCIIDQRGSLDSAPLP